MHFLMLLIILMQKKYVRNSDLYCRDLANSSINNKKSNLMNSFEELIIA